MHVENHHYKTNAGTYKIAFIKDGSGSLKKERDLAIQAIMRHKKHKYQEAATIIDNGPIRIEKS